MINKHINKYLFAISNYKLLILVYYTLIYLILAKTSFIAEYVEGDDARTMIYHLMGRNLEIQHPYSPNHSGADYFLSFFSANEPLLLNIGMGFSFIFGYFGLILLFLWVSLLDKLNQNTKIVFGLTLPFIIPEFLFDSLIYNPTNVGFTFCMLSLISLELFIKRRRWIYLTAIPLLLMIAVPIRWTLFTFVATLFAYYVYRTHELGWTNIRDNLKLLSILLLSIITPVLGIYASGFDLPSVLEVFFWTNAYQSELEFSWSALLSNGFAFFSPSLILILLYGMLKHHQPVNRKVLLVLIAIIPYFALGIKPNLKYSISLLPIICLFSIAGVQWLLDRPWGRYLFFPLTVLPWFVGIKLHTTNYAYGPGFEINQWQSNKGYRSLSVISKSPDSRLKNLNPQLSMKAGFLMPTSEGPRPLYGFGHCLFFGKWKEMINELSVERINLLKELHKLNIRVVLQDSKHAILPCLLYRYGYNCQMSWKTLNENFFYRDFKKQKQTIRIVVPVNYTISHQTIEKLNRTEQQFGLYLSYTHMAQMVQEYSEIKRLGPYTLIKEN